MGLAEHRTGNLPGTEVLPDRVTGLAAGTGVPLLSPTPGAQIPVGRGNQRVVRSRPRRFRPDSR
jgi:hypothetical protein